MDNDVLRKNIKRKRLEAQKTQEEMAKRLGIQRSTYGEYERGNIKPSIDMIEAIAKILMVDPQELTGWGERDMINNRILLQKEQMEASGMLGAVSDPFRQLETMQEKLMDLAYTYNPVYRDLCDLGLSESELEELYNYAQYLKHKRGKEK